MGEFPLTRRGQQIRPDTNEWRERPRVGLACELMLAGEQVASLAASFPSAALELTDQDPLGDVARFDVLVIAAAPADAPRVGARIRQSVGCKFIVVLESVNLAASRALIANGAADVIYAPATEANLTLSMDRIFAGLAGASRNDARAGQVVALLKAGGGVGATSLGVQAAAVLSARGEQVCFADLDVQGGAGALYMDLPDGLSVTDCVAAGDALAETNFATSLATHRSGARLLAAPNDIAPLELLGHRQVESLVRTLRQAMALTIVDLPSDWTAWTNQLLHMADRIVLVTRLTVSNVQLAKRQLRMIGNQQLELSPLLLVCNAVSHAQEQALSIKAAERALGRRFDLVIADESRAMSEALNQGVELAAVRGAGKLLKSITALADALHPAHATAAPR